MVHTYSTRLKALCFLTLYKMPNNKIKSRYGPKGTAAVKALQMAKDNKKKLRNLQHEKKFINKEEDDLTVSDNGVFKMLNSIAIGDTATTREGRKLLMKKLRTSFRMENNPDVSVNATNIRIIIFKDTMSNGTGLPALTDLLNSQNILSFISVSNIPQYQILFDRMYNISNNGNTPLIIRKINKYKMNIPVWFSDNSDTDNSIQKNALILFMMSDRSPAENPPLVSYKSRIRFIDN